MEQRKNSVPDVDGLPQTAESSEDHGPWLWNPDVAALLSWLGLTSAFGATVQAANWKRLGQPREMWASLAWATVLPISLCVVGVSVAILKYKGSLALLTVATTFLNVVAWYFLSGRKQSKYIVFKLKGRYRRDSWFIPVVLALIVALSPKIIGWLS